MTEAGEILALSPPLGLGATAILDLWGLAKARILGAGLPDYGLVGRWLLYLPRGRFFHRPITASPALRGERVAGWCAHYLIGVMFAGLLLALTGTGWARHPALLPALAVGIGSVAAPFLLMQPGMGQGIAACRAPHPGAARIRSLTTHAVFGLGLYLTGWCLSRWLLA